MAYAVLVVDDDRDIASVMTEVLIDEGFNATPVFDGQQALDHVGRSDIDLLVSDIRMPYIDGLTLIRRLREQGWSKPIVLMSAVESVQPPDWERVVFLRKPIDIEELVVLVRRLLDESPPAMS